MKKMNQKGLAYAAGAAMLLMILTTAYTIYNAYGIPKYCKQYEARALAEFLDDVKALAATQKEVIRSATPSAVFIRSQYPYPSIPFFTTPSYISIGDALYDITVKINNVASDDVSIPSSLTFTGKAVWLKYNSIYTTPVTAFIELGIVATDGAYVGGDIVSDGTIYLPFFAGDKLMLQIYPQSAGGKGILIKALDPTQNITLRISGSKIPRNVWTHYASERGINITFVNNDVILHLPPGNYTLITGVTSFGEGAKMDAAYLIPHTALNQKSPAVIDVEAIDEYFNPVETEIELRCVIGCPLEVCTPSTSSLQCSPLGAVKYYDDEASAVVRKSDVGTSIVVASVNRPTGSPYELAFSITNS